MPRKLTIFILVALVSLVLMAPVAQAQGPMSGKVLETMDSGGYTYIHVEKAGMKMWVAIPSTKGIEVGQTVTFQPGMTMRNFKSSTLGRTFDAIYFSGGLAK